MPMFEYVCKDCGTVSEFLVGVSAELDSQRLVCDSCGSGSIKRKLSIISVRVPAADSFCGCASESMAGGSQMAGGCCGGACHGH